MTSFSMRRHTLGHTRGVVHPLKGKGGSYPLGVVPPLWLKASSYRSLSGKVHGQLESELEGAMDVRVLTLIVQHCMDVHTPSLELHTYTLRCMNTSDGCFHNDEKDL